MDVEKGHVSIRRGVSWSPGGIRKPLPTTQDLEAPSTECNASWEQRGFTGQPSLSPSPNQMGRKTNLTRSVSLSDKELKEARVRSQIIAAQLTVPSNSNSRGVQLFNRRKQRVNAFTLESPGEKAAEERAGSVKTVPPCNTLTWAERSSKDKDIELNCKNSATKMPWSPAAGALGAGDIMEDPGEHVHEVEDVKVTVMSQERHFVPVSEKEELELEEEDEAVEVEVEEVKVRGGQEVRDEFHEDLKFKGEITPEIDVPSPAQLEPVQLVGGVDGELASAAKLPNGCHGGNVSVSLSKQTPAIVNRTARPFFSPLTVLEATSPVMDIPPAPSYSTPPLPTFAAPRPAAFSPLPPPPSYPTPPLPAFTNQPPQTFSSPPPQTFSSPPPQTFSSPPPQTFSSPPPQTFSSPPPQTFSSPPPQTFSSPPPQTFSSPPPQTFSSPPPQTFSSPPPQTFSSPPPQTFSSPPPLSPVMSCRPVSQFPPAAPPVSQYVPPNPPPEARYGPPTGPRPSTFVPQPIGEWRPMTTIKTGILEEGAAKRTNRKAMFTFKEKTVVAPNPELLSLVQGADERKKHGNRYVPEPTSEEELLALGAEASNFLAEEVRTEEAKAPEWASCLKSSRTRERAEHKPEQNLTNVSGKGAQLFAKRQSRMEKYVLESQNAGQMRSPSPTMSLPPSWVFPSNMPGRVKAIAKNSDMSAQLSQNLIKAQQSVKRKPSVKAPGPAPVPEPPPLENGCTKIEMDLSRHQPYQINASLFIFNPVKDPMSSLPRAAPPPPKPLITSQSFSRQTPLPGNPPPHFSSYNHRSAQCMSPQFPLSPTGGANYPPSYGSTPASRQQRITSPVSAFSPDRVTSPWSGGHQAPRPTFSAKKAGIEAQTTKESCLPSTPTRTPNLPRRFSSPEGPASWSPSLQTRHTSSSISSSRPSVTSPVPPPWGSRCQSPMVGQTTQPSTVSSVSTSRPAHTPTATTPVSPPWGSRCQSPMVCQTGQPSTISSVSTSRPAHTPTATTPVSAPWGSRCQSPMVGQTTQPSTISSVSTSRPAHTPTATTPVSAPWGSRCQSPMVGQTTQPHSATKPLYTSTATSPVSLPRESRCMSPVVGHPDSKANHRLLAKNIINAAKRKNSPSPGHGLPISPLGASHHGYDCSKPPFGPLQPPPFASPPPTPRQMICSPARLYNTRSLTDSDASVESEDSGLRSPGLRSYNTCPRGWGGSLRVKRGSVSTDL